MPGNISEKVGGQGQPSAGWLREWLELPTALPSKEGSERQLRSRKHEGFDFSYGCGDRSEDLKNEAARPL